MGHDGLPVMGAQLDCICRTASSIFRCTGCGDYSRDPNWVAAVNGSGRMRLKPCYGLASVAGKGKFVACRAAHSDSLGGKHPAIRCPVLRC